MAAERSGHYWLPRAWRGVASPGYARLTRWHELVEELGGTRASSSFGQSPLAEFLTSPVSKAGTVNMSLLTQAAESEQLDALQRIFFEQLTRHERLVLMLFYAEGLSLGEIAEVLDLPEATVAELFSKTIKTLRAHFD
jgi:RNA polymerase sigma factor (sigma-70 family)